MTSSFRRLVNYAKRIFPLILVNTRPMGIIQINRYLTSKNKHSLRFDTFLKSKLLQIGEILEIPPMKGLIITPISSPTSIGVCQIK